MPALATSWTAEGLYGLPASSKLPLSGVYRPVSTLKKVVLPAPGVHVDQRIAAINSALSFDSTSPMSAINEPKLHVVDECYNLIWCLAEHTGRDGQKGASKDPIDCLGMLLTSSCDYVAPGGMNSYGGGSY